MIVGPDLSHYNFSFDPTKATGPVDFAFQKATEGYSFVDPLYEEIWQGVKQIPVRGAYHYQRSGLSWLAQADHFLETASKHDYHIYALDLESTFNSYGDTFFTDTRRIIDHWRHNSLKQIALYTNASTYDLMYLSLTRAYGAEGGRWADNQYLWISRPDNPAGFPVMPNYRPGGWTFHQYTYKGLPSRWGTGEHGVDENLFNGDVNKLQEWAGITTQPQQPEGETTVSQWYQVIVPVLNIRSTPVVMNFPTNDIGDLLKGERFEVSTISGSWGKITNVQHLDGTLQNMTGEAWANVGAAYCKACEAPNVEPPDKVYPVSVSLAYADGTMKKYLPE